MALPIGETPILRGKDAVAFITKVKRNERKLARPIPTPKLDEARRLIEAHARSQQKHIH